ncbi:MAG: DUF1934 domain-containing protein [Peptococcaceae bacterium]|nr:DUF1934 domain-containing protein [Peptococcaceae bacterium]
MNNGKKVLITVAAIQESAEGDDSTISLVTQGKYYQKNNAYYLLYEESEISGMEGTTTSIKAETGKVVLNRMGTLQFRQVFEQGQPYKGVYLTSVGVFDVQVLPSRVAVDLNSSGGSIQLEYDIEVDNQRLGFNRLSILVEELCGAE